MRDEGVEVSEDAMGVFSVDLAVWGWFPEWLPSEEAERREEGAGDESGGDEESEEEEEEDMGERIARDEREGRA